MGNSVSVTGYTGGKDMPHGYVHEAVFYRLAPLNSESERAAMNWVSENLDDLRDMTTEETAHEGFISGVEWLMSQIRATGP